MDSYSNLQHSFEQKGRYDELVDDYSAPRHQTFTVTPTLSPQHRRGPSFPLTPNSVNKMSADASTEDLNPIYPPLSSKEIGAPKPNIWTKIIPESMACRLFVLTVLVETAIDLAIEGAMLITLNDKTQADFAELGPAQKKMRVYLSLFALAHVFQFVMAVDAVYARNTLQFMALIIFNAAFLIYSIVQTTEIRQEPVFQANTDSGHKNPILALATIVPIVISIAEVAFIALGWKIYNEFGWKVYKFLGADRRVKRMYANYQIYLCLIKFDVFFWAGFSVQFIVLVLNKGEWEFYITCAALPLSLILLVEGHLAARHENKWMMAVFMSGCVAALVYFIYKLSRVLMDINGTLFKEIWKSLTIFSVLAIMILLVTFVYSIMVLRNFGYGLKDALARKDAQEHKRGPSQAPHRRHASAHLNRMSIE